jgi:hypothetical protein
MRSAFVRNLLLTLYIYSLFPVLGSLISVLCSLFLLSRHALCFERSLLLTIYIYSLFPIPYSLTPTFTLPLIAPAAHQNPPAARTQ